MFRIYPCFLFAVGVSLTGMTGRAETGAKTGHGWQGLLDDSPFGTASLVNPPSPGSLEFRGFVREGDELWVNLYDPMAKRSEWCSVPGSPASGLRVEAYDPATEHLIVQQAGRRLSLALRLGHVVLPADIRPLVVAVTSEPPASDENAREAFIRQLPADAREMLEQAQRRRHQRVPAPEAPAGPAVNAGYSQP
jgi:hypothetical protein